MYCKNCGFEVKGSSKFCAHCGNAINRSQAESSNVINRNQTASGNAINRNQAAKRNIKMPSVRIWAVVGIIVFIGIILIAVSNNNKRSYNPYTPYTQNENITQQQTQPQVQNQPVAENPPVSTNNFDYSYNPYAPYGLSSDFLSGDVFGNPYYDPNNPYNIYDYFPSPNNSGDNSVRIQQLERYIADEYESMENLRRSGSVTNDSLMRSKRELIQTYETELRRLRGY